MSYAGRDLAAKRTYAAEYWLHTKRLAIRHLGGECVECGDTDDLQLHHIEPLLEWRTGQRQRDWRRAAKGDTEGLQLLCESCHREHHMVDTN
jgi:5-methylcytosine-specific restriction endonuclease McrA